MSARQTYQALLDNLMEEADYTADLLIAYATANKHSRTTSAVNDYYRAMLSLQGQALMLHCLMIAREIAKEGNKDDAGNEALISQLLTGMKRRASLYKVPPPSVWNIGIKVRAEKSFKDYLDSLEEDEELGWDDDDDDIMIWIDLDDED